jgi:hypothetical protein
MINFVFRPFGNIRPITNYNRDHLNKNTNELMSNFNTQV